MVFFWQVWSEEVEFKLKRNLPFEEPRESRSGNCQCKGAEVGKLGSWGSEEMQVSVEKGRGFG